MSLPPRGFQFGNQSLATTAHGAFEFTTRVRISLITTRVRISLATVERDRSCDTAVFKKVATFNIDFASLDGNRTHQNAFSSCDSNFIRKTIETEPTKNFDSQIERRLFRSKKSLVMS